MRQGSIAYHSIEVVVDGKTPFSAIDFQFPAHHKRCTGLQIECSLVHTDFEEGQVIGDLGLEFMGESLNFHHCIRYASLPYRHAHFWDFHALCVELKPNKFTKGHFTNAAQTMDTTVDKEGKPITALTFCAYTLTLTFRITIDGINT